MPVERILLILLVLTAASVPPWRQALDATWTNASSPRALLVSHGGAWDLRDPYSSFGAFERAFVLGSDGAKGDYRVSKDGVGVVVHSSPFVWYESWDCRGQRCEQMTAEAVTQCDMYLTSWKVCSRGGVPVLFAQFAHLLRSS